METIIMSYPPILGACWMVSGNGEGETHLLYLTIQKRGGPPAFPWGVPTSNQRLFWPQAPAMEVQSAGCQAWGCPNMFIRARPTPGS